MTRKQNIPRKLAYETNKAKLDILKDNFSIMKIIVDFYFEKWMVRDAKIINNNLLKLKSMIFFSNIILSKKTPIITIIKAIFYNIRTEKLNVIKTIKKCIKANKSINIDKIKAKEDRDKILTSWYNIIKTMMDIVNNDNL